MGKDSSIQSDAWAAGFFDGEGYVGILQRNSSGRFELALSIRQCDPEPLRHLQKRFGGWLSVHKVKTKNCRPAWSWSLTRQRCLPFLRAIQPFLMRTILKRRISVAIEFQVQVKSSGRADAKYTRRQKGFYLRMHKLKTRGLKNG